MKEEDARNKWCPQKRIMFFRDNRPMAHLSCNSVSIWGEAQEEIDSVAITLTENKTFKCIASDCMMWAQTDNEVEPEYPGTDCEDVSYPAGHCGLVK